MIYRNPLTLGSFITMSSCLFLFLANHPQNCSCVFPREGGRGSVQVTADDLSRLESLEFLNDTVIDFYLK